MLSKCQPLASASAGIFCFWRRVCLLLQREVFEVDSRGAQQVPAERKPTD
jgi:hypothetical protein